MGTDTSNSPNKRNAWYVLRKTLPLWSFERDLAELVELCPRYRIDEVMVKVDAEEFSHGLPTLEWVKNYQPYLFRAKQELERIGVVFSINPWVTLVHCDRGWDSTGIVSDAAHMVGHDGVVCKCCCCPLSEEWRSHTKKLWRIYAETEPAVLWVEDDIRTFNHPPVKYGCFCDLHRARFSEIMQQPVSREELVRAILAPGKPHPFRQAWLELQGEVMIEVARMLEKTVHEISPRTKLGLMSSDPPHHAAEGRNWHGLIRALAGPNTPVNRPTMGHYREPTLRGLYDGEYLLKLTRHCLPENVVLQPEVENAPYTRYSKSDRFTFLQMALSFAMGADGAALNLYDHCGTPMESNPSVGKMLADNKAFLNGIAQRCLPSGVFSGIRILHNDQASCRRVLNENADYEDLVPDGYKWQSIIEPSGFAITYSASEVTALSGQTVRSFTDDEIKGFLAQGTVVDLSAMKVLFERGFKEFLGASIKSEFPVFSRGPLAAEEFFDTQFGGRPNTYLTIKHPDSGGNAPIAELEPAPGARVLSRLVDPDTREKYPFLTIFENSLGGRVALYPIDIEYAASVPFLNPHRQNQLYHVLKWLSRDRLPLFVDGGVYPLALRSDYPDRIIVTVFNLSLDPWPFVKIQLHIGDRRPSSVEILDRLGRWVRREDVNLRIENSNAELQINDALSFELPMLISINFEN